jgi:hypothetical protein
MSHRQAISVDVISKVFVLSLFVVLKESGVTKPQFKSKQFAWD